MWSSSSFNETYIRPGMLYSIRKNKKKSRINILTHMGGAENFIRPNDVLVPQNNKIRTSANNNKNKNKTPLVRLLQF